MSGTRGDVVVIGGGVIGAASAHYLAESGWKVTLVERDRFGSGCSHANCGLVCPSHVLPLAAPGAVRTAIQALFRPAGPLSIKPRLDPALWTWLYQFARRCNRRDMIQAGHGIQALLDSSRRLYDHLFRTEPLDCEWQTKGLLFVLGSRRGMDHFAVTNDLLTETFGLPAKRFDGEAVNELEPALRPGLAGGWLYPSDAHLRPDRLLASWRRVLESRGVTIHENCPVTAIVRDSGQARAVVTPGGELAAEAFVVATGALTPRLSSQLGCRIPIQPGKGYSITMPRPARCPSIPLVFEQERVVATPLESGYRLGSTMEFAGYDTTLNPKRLTLLRTAARRYLREPYCEPVEEQWYGWRPMTWDGLPIIDRSPAMGNVVIAAGHNMLGLSMAPATGRLIAELLSGRAPHIDPAPYAVSRFGRSGRSCV